MIIQELINKIENNTDLKEILEIRTYIPITEKRAILETVLDECINIEDGVVTCDYITMKMAFELAMIKYHTDLEIKITSEDNYDEIQKLGIDFHSEYLVDYEECQSLFEGMKQELYSKYSIESSIAQLSNKISGSIDNIVGVIAEKVASLDMSKFGFEGLELDKFKNLLNKYGNKV